MLFVPGVHEMPDVSAGSLAAEAGTAGLQSETATVWHCFGGVVVASHVPVSVQVAGHTVWHSVVASGVHEATFCHGVQVIWH